MIKKKKRKPLLPSQKKSRQNRFANELANEVDRLREENMRLRQESALREQRERDKRKALFNNCTNAVKCPACGATWFKDTWANYCGPGDTNYGTRVCGGCGGQWELIS